jgi:hypothetical protein
VVRTDLAAQALAMAALPATIRVLVRMVETAFFLLTRMVLRITALAAVAAAVATTAQPVALAANPAEEMAARIPTLELPGPQIRVAAVAALVDTTVMVTLSA